MMTDSGGVSEISRLRAGGTHLVISFCLLVLLAIGMHFSGYTWPIWYLQGAVRLFGMVVFVDLCLGPSITLIISNPKKPRRELLRDWTIIALVQIVALGYGAYTLWEGRPIVAVVAVDRIEVMSANTLQPKRLEMAQTKCELIHDTGMLPKWPVCLMVARMPQDSKLRQDILFSAVGGGPDLSGMPEYYVPPVEAKQDILDALRPVDVALKNVPAMAAGLKASLARLGVKEDQVKILWVLGRAKSAFLVYRVSDNALLDTLFE